MLENSQALELGTHNNTTLPVQITPAGHQETNEHARDNNDANIEDGTPSRFKRPRSLSRNRPSSTNKSRRTSSDATPTGNFDPFRNRLPSPARAENMDFDLSPDLFQELDQDDNRSIVSISSTINDEILALRERIIQAASEFKYFVVEFDPKATSVLLAALAFYQVMGKSLA